MANSTNCRSTSFYIAPGVKLLFSDWSLTAILGDGETVEITHRDQVAKLIKNGWDGTSVVTEKATGASEQITVDGRVISGKLPHDTAGFRVEQVLNGGGIEGVGGAKQLAETLFGFADSELGRKAFELIQAAGAGDPDAWEKLVNLSRSNEASRHAWSKFLDAQDPGLHRTLGVEQADADNPSGPTQKAAGRIDWWIRALERDVLAGSPQQREEFLRGLLELGVMNAGDVPESVYEAEQRQAREDGEGFIGLTDSYRAAKAAEIRTAQKESLTAWFEYLTSDDAAAAGYPMHARYWALAGAMRMGKLELVDDGDGGERVRFSRRTAGTVAPFCELNRNVLAQTIEAMQHHVLQWQLTPRSTAARNARVTGRQQAPGTVRSVNNTSSTLTDDEFYELVSGGNFSNIYTVFLNDYLVRRAGSLENTAGKWVCYRQGSDAGELYGSLQGHTLEWCTAGAKSTAQSQLNGGDFWVFYSEDKDGNAVVPRIAIRKDGNRIGEVRGCVEGQNLDPFIGGVLTEKLQDTENFPNSEEYIQGAEDTEFLTDLERRLGASYDSDGFQGYKRSDAVLTPDELAKLYEMDEDLVSNGYRDDPRVAQLRAGRDALADLADVCGLDLTDHNEIALALIANGRSKGVVRYLDRFDGLNSETALALISAGDGRSLANNLEKFNGLDHNEIAQALIADGQGRYVAGNIDKFDGLDHNEIAQAFIADGQGRYVAGNIDKFDGLDHNEIARALIAAGDGGWVADNLGKFEGLNHNEIALALIAGGSGGSVAHNLDKFKGLNHTDAALVLIEGGDSKSLANFLYNFKGLNSEIALVLIAAGSGGAVAKHLNSFEGLNYEVAQALIEAGDSKSVANFPYNFKGLNSEIALVLIAAGSGGAVAKHLNSFEGLNYEVAQALIAGGKGGSVAENLNKFGALTPEVAQAFIAGGNGEWIAKNLDKFEGLNHNEIAQQLIAGGGGLSVVAYLDKFKGLNHNDVALALIEGGYGWYIAENLNSLEDLNHREIALALIATEYGWRVADNLHKFKGLNHNDAALALIEGGNSKSVANFLYNFKGLNSEVALALIAAGAGKSVAKHLRSFEGLEHNEVALALIAAGDGESVLNSLNDFEGLTQETLDLLGVKQR